MNHRYSDEDEYGMGPRVIVLEMYYQNIKNYNYLVVDSGSNQAVIVDPAWEIEKVDKALFEARATLGGVLITHAHPDHVHLAQTVADKYDCPIWMSDKTWRASGLSSNRILIMEVGSFKVGQMSIESIPTPGHTPGCTCYRIGENLFSGDALFAEGCGICPDIPSAHAMFASLENLKAIIRPQTRVFPGHSYGKPPGQRMSELLKDNIYLQFTNENSFAAFRLRAGQNRAKMFSFT